jgi:putative oxidoreductase
MKIARLLLRTAVGGFFVGHGTQKLFGWFGGSGLDATAGNFGKLGLHPAKAHATAAGIAEAGGGAALLVGLETPLAAAAIVATMLTAIRTVHLKNGPWVTSGGYEYNVVLIAAALAAAELGPGPLSLDALLGRERSGTGWALAAAGAGALGALGVYAQTALSAAPEQSAGQAGAEEQPTSAPRSPVPPAAEAA